jgi:hypothetical protein
VPAALPATATTTPSPTATATSAAPIGAPTETLRQVLVTIVVLAIEARETRESQPPVQVPRPVQIPD